MKKNKWATLKEYQTKVEALEKELGRMQQKLLSLPGKHGFGSMDDFIDALRAASGAGGKSAKSGGKTRRKRAVITTEMKQKLKAMVNDGKTGGEIANSLGISLPSVHNIKKELGLVKKRK